MVNGSARLALISEVADLVLKGGGILAMAGVVGATALKMSMLIVIIPMVVTGLLLWVSAGFLFMLAVVRLEEAFVRGPQIHAIGATAIGFTFAALIVFSMMGLIIDLGAGFTATPLQ